MTNDNYAPCPCGSGKKMKFCKCVDQPQEYEKIMRLIEAGQELAALDRINQLLSKTPSAAWLLAIKAELALALDESETFKETAVRFAKLKPDNPLALIMRSIVSLMDREPMENTVRYLLDGLAESREALPGLVLTSLNGLINALGQSVKAPLRFYWIQLLHELQAKSEENAQPVEGSSDGSLLTIATPLILPDPPGAAWSERLKEVIALRNAFRYAQAETKLRAILRDYPDQPGPLSHLLAAQCVLLEQDNAVTTARKLSTHRDLTSADRDYFAAMALELEPNNPSLQIPSLFKYCEIQSDEEASRRLSGLDFLESIPDEYSAGIRQIYAASVLDEVPAKIAYNAVSTVRETGDATRVLASVGSVLLFGKQTDKPARALVMLFDLPGDRELFDKIVAQLGVVKDLEDPSPSRANYYISILERARFRRKSADEVESLALAEQSPLLVEDFLNLRFAGLDNQTLLEAVESEPKRAAVRAIVTHLEAAHQVLMAAGTMEAIYDRLQLDSPMVKLTENPSEFKPRTLLEIARLDIRSFADPLLIGTFGSVIGLDVRRTSVQIAQEILARPNLQMPEAARGAALEICSGLASTVDESLRLLEQLEDSLVKQGKPVGRIILQRMNMLGSLNRRDDVRAVIEKGLREHPNDPYLLSFIQYINQQLGSQGGMGSVDDSQLLARMGGRQRMDAAEDAAPASSLVLPGQETATEGKSKLWLPGS